MNVKQLFQDPYKVMPVALLLLIIFNFNSFGSTAVLASVFTIVFTSIVVDSAVNYVQLKQLRVSDTSIISGLVLSLVISPQTPLLYLIAAPAIAQLSKHIIRYKDKPVFNPAGFGLFIVLLAFPAGEAWWANAIPLLTLAFGLYVSYRIARLVGSFSFLASFLVFNAVASLVQNVAFSLDAVIALAASQLFLAFYMIVEPKSTTSKIDGQIIYGTVAGLVAVVGFVLHLPAPLLLGLLCGNLVATRYK